MRLFVASRVTAGASAKVAALVATMSGRLPRAAWAPAHSHHVTFAFLGEQPAEVVPKLAEALLRELADVAAIDATMSRGGFFPSDRRPRVGWIAIGPEASLGAIAQRVRTAVASCGVELAEVIAREDGIPVTSVHATIYGKVDRGHPVRPDVTLFNEVRMTFRIAGATPEQAGSIGEKFTKP